MARELAVGLAPRVEGDISIKVVVEGKAVRDVEIKVFEAPRLFEYLLKGLPVEDFVEVAPRICGICSAAHQLAALHAVERALGIEVSEQTEQLRKLLAYGGIIQSHALHLFFLAMPDFFNSKSIFELPKEALSWLKLGLRVKELGNTLVEVIGGRATHPVTPVIGGFSKLPEDRRLRKLGSMLEEALEGMKGFTQFLAGIELPGIEGDYALLALKADGEYPVAGEKLALDSGRVLDAHRFKEHVTELVKQGSTTKITELKDGGSRLAVGPLARICINLERLSSTAGELLRELGIEVSPRNPFHYHVARALEITHFMEAASETIREMRLRDEKVVKPSFREGEGVAVVEAPRGILYYRVVVGGDGRVRDVDVVTPTVHNVGCAEKVLLGYASELAHLDEEKLLAECEKLVRCFDFCISCSVHVEKLSSSMRH